MVGKLVLENNWTEQNQFYDLLLLIWSPIDVGISPNKLFLEISIWLIFFKLPTSNGSLTVNELWDKLMYSSGNEEIPISCWSIDPLRLFCEMSKICKFWRFTKLGGMVPSNPLLSKANSNNWVRLSKEVGISPDSLFPNKPNLSLFSNFSKVVGMMHVKWFPFKSKKIKLTWFFNNLGMVPNISLSPNNIRMKIRNISAFFNSLCVVCCYYFFFFISNI